MDIALRTGYKYTSKYKNMLNFRMHNKAYSILILTVTVIFAFYGYEFVIDNNEVQYNENRIAEKYQVNETSKFQQDTIRESKFIESREVSNLIRSDRAINIEDGLAKANENIQKIEHLGEFLDVESDSPPNDLQKIEHLGEFFDVESDSPPKDLEKIEHLGEFLDVESDSPPKDLEKIEHIGEFIAVESD